MTNWTSTKLVSVDEVGDRTGASNGYSRYGAYVEARPTEFHEFEDPQTPLSADEFAAAAWRVATPPVLIGYVMVRPDLDSITTTFTENGDLVVRVAVPLWFSDLPGDRRPRYPWQDWTTQYDISTRDEKYRRTVEPEIKADRPAVLTMANVVIPTANWDLPAPQHTKGRGLVDEAQAVVREIARQVNAHAGPMVAHLLGDKD